MRKEGCEVNICWALLENIFGPLLRGWEGGGVVKTFLHIPDMAHLSPDVYAILFLSL